MVWLWQNLSHRVWWESHNQGNAVVVVVIVVVVVVVVVVIMLSVMGH